MGPRTRSHSQWSGSREPWQTPSPQRTSGAGWLSDVRRLDFFWAEKNPETWKTGFVILFECLCFFWDLNFIVFFCKNVILFLLNLWSPQNHGILIVVGHQHQNIPGKNAAGNRRPAHLGESLKSKKWRRNPVIMRSYEVYSFPYFLLFINNSWHKTHTITYFLMIGWYWLTDLTWLGPFEQTKYTDQPSSSPCHQVVHYLLPDGCVHVYGHQGVPWDAVTRCEAVALKDRGDVTHNEFEGLRKFKSLQQKWYVTFKL